jgi:hypothetical protein
MAEQPQQDKVSVDLALHHALKVELDISLARQADVIA